ncbi:AAA family ATPase [Kibdelosporangium aridum]|uniref:AAA family ATPase n=1 Tax=Kibdelosporangium aridum TaxID=2030 RepID=UPI0035F0BDAD
MLIGDEINRASPKTQAALLQAMGERSVTIGLHTLPLPEPFFCVATQNPIEHHGTYPLPEAQLDRFLMRVTIDYPAPMYEQQVIAQEIAAAENAKSEQPRVDAVTDIGEVAEQVRSATRIGVGDALRDYIVRIVTHTRSEPTVKLGASPRAAIAMARAAQVSAASRGRRFATPDDVKAVAEPVLAHRLQLTHEASVQGITAAMVVEKTLTTVDVPRHADERQ